MFGDIDQERMATGRTKPAGFGEQGAELYDNHAKGQVHGH